MVLEGKVCVSEGIIIFQSFVVQFVPTLCFSPIHETMREYNSWDKTSCLAICTLFQALLLYWLLFLFYLKKVFIFAHRIVQNYGKRSFTKHPFLKTLKQLYVPEVLHSCFKSYFWLSLCIFHTYLFYWQSQ